ncbi:MAG: serine hydrolase [Candidatus Thorarchaeota archaeon]
MIIDTLDKDFVRRLDELIIKEMTTLGTPGLSMGIIKGDELIFTRSYGTRNYSKSLPVTEDTLFLVASVTKSFISSCILKLVEQGKISLEDEVNKFVEFELGFPDNPIRIKHLMTHTSGIPNLSDLLYHENEEDTLGYPISIPKIPFTSIDDIFRHINMAREYVTDPPGKRFYYNNLMYNILGFIISKINGMSLNDFLSQNILVPLEMNRSTLNIDKALADENHSEGYITKPGSKTSERVAMTNKIKQLENAAGGLYSNIKELSNYVVMHLNQGRFHEKQVLSPEHIELMQNLQFVEEYPNEAFSSFYGNYGKTGYGLGFVIHEDFFGYKLIEHSGSYDGSSAWLAMIPDLQIGVIFLSNYHPSPRMFAQAVMLMLLGLDVEKNFPLLIVRNHQKKLSGYYETYRGIQKIKVFSKLNTLFIQDMEEKRPPQAIFPSITKGEKLEYLNYYMFTDIGGMMPVQFEIDKFGSIWIHIEREKYKKIKELLYD